MVLKGFCALPTSSIFEAIYHNQYFQNIRNADLCYWRFRVIKSFIFHMRYFYGKSWETMLRLLIVQDQSKYFWEKYA